LKVPRNTTTTTNDILEKLWFRSACCFPDSFPHFFADLVKKVNAPELEKNICSIFIIAIKAAVVQELNQDIVQVY